VIRIEGNRHRARERRSGAFNAFDRLGRSVLTGAIDVDLAERLLNFSAITIAGVG
jgi:hypothetical protein